MDQINGDTSTDIDIGRRTLMGGIAGLSASLWAGSSQLLAEDSPPTSPPKGRIKQSLVHWCYRDHFKDFDALCAAAVKLGCKSIELCDPKFWPTLKKHGLTCAIASGGHGFKQGPNHKENWDFCREKLSERIQLASEAGFKRVITFNGFTNGISDEEGADNCVAFFKSIIGKAEKAGITLCLEMLNTRDDTHPMKGHPGYQGDDTEYCIDICKRVGSKNMKLLFDIYHVQIMNGDVIRRIHQHKDYLGHIHTAGNPGRGELHVDQEINYPAVMKALIDVGYDGFVGQEYIPNKKSTDDVYADLQQAVQLCDV